MRNILNVTALFLLCLGGFFLFRGHCHADCMSIQQQYIFDRNCLIYPGDDDYVDPSLATYHKFRKHRDHAIEFFVLAEETAWYLPDYDDKDMAKLCFTTSLALYAPVDVVSKVIAASLAVFSEYGLHTIDRWNQVQHCLHRAIYHADMMQFYYEIWKKEEQGLHI